ncbi:MAG: hypothetical protein ABEJ87_02650 [Candidatus Nanohalobium sp.]
MSAERITSEEGLERLQQDSKPLNESLEQALNGLEDLSSGFLVPPLQDRRCALCDLEKFPCSVDENVMVEDEDYLVVEAADKNTHRVRNMIVLKDHEKYPSDEELENYATEALKDLVNYSSTEEGQRVAVYADMNTFNHPHIMASDLEPEDPGEAALESINNYLVFKDSESLGEPEAEYYGDSVGEGLLERFYGMARKGL